MNKPALANAAGWGVALWLFGYVLGIVLFFVVPAAMIGWVILPIGTAVTVWVLLSRVERDTFRQYVILAAVWTEIAIVGDYLFIVLALNPDDGYYKLDVGLYYMLTFLLPFTVGWWKTRNTTGPD